MWFIRGDTNNQTLIDQNVHIWDANSSREFLDSRGLSNYSEGLLGPIYGRQWRYFDAPYNAITGETNEGGGIDQLQKIINALNNPKERKSRRLIMTAWNPKQIDEMALPPCHILCQFNVCDNNKLSCIMYARSQDLALGTPFNISSYCLLTHLIAKQCDLVADELNMFLGNCHIYEEHIKDIKKVIDRKPFAFPSIEITKKADKIDEYCVDDFLVHNYQHHDTIVMKMIA
jgi:thymidylate synthase